MIPVLYVIIKVLNLYQFLIVVWAFGSFFPQWRYQNWFRTLSGIVEPYVNLFRTLNLTFGQFDFSPFAAILAITVFQWMLQAVAMKL